MSAPTSWAIGQVWQRGDYRWRVYDTDARGFAWLRSERDPMATTRGVTLAEWTWAGWVCIDTLDPPHRSDACETGADDCVRTCCCPAPRDEGETKEEIDG